MPNPLTMQVESRMGALFISLLALFFVGLVFIALKNFNSDSITLNAQTAEIKTISNTERILMANWVQENGIEIPEGKGYRYLIQKYPSKPWLRQD